MMCQAMHDAYMLSSAVNAVQLESHLSPPPACFPDACSRPSSSSTTPSRPSTRQRASCRPPRSRAAASATPSSVTEWRCATPTYNVPRKYAPKITSNFHTLHLTITISWTLTQAILTLTLQVRQSKISNAIIGLRSLIGEGCHIEDAMIIGADYYETEEERAALLAAGKLVAGGAVSFIALQLSV